MEPPAPGKSIRAGALRAESSMLRPCVVDTPRGGNGRGARLPRARGPLSGIVCNHLARAPHMLPAPLGFAGDALADDDLHLALYICYELHYRGFAGVDEGWEWYPPLIALRARLEWWFEAALRRRLPEMSDVHDIAAALQAIVDVDDSPSVSAELAMTGTLSQYREFMVHRSAYQLKEADPHTWAIPRLDGLPKATLVGIQAEEYGEGSLDRMHSVLFGRAMEAVGLDSGYGAYIDHIPGSTLATVNLMSLFGLHRRLRGAIVGHLAVFEMTSSGNALLRRARGSGQRPRDHGPPPPRRCPGGGRAGAGGRHPLRSAGARGGRGTCCPLAARLLA